MTVALAALAVFLGATLQSATGFGFSLVAAPMLFALLGPREAVSAGVLLGLLLNGLTLATERRRPEVLGDAWRLVAWSVPGLVLGALALRELPERPLSALVGLAVLAGLAVRLRGSKVAVRLRAWHAPAAGATSGALATANSVSGPPLAFYLLGRGATPAAMRDTLAAVFIAQSLLALPVLLLSATFRVPAAVWALLAAALAGQLAGRRAFAWLRGERHEHAVLAVLVLSALAALAAGVL
ncbi:MAG: sulfite exporter TauE/SafE family protein [Solirubrobacteraceae bacterium]|nr:sulfite exporter TauE/SafE family protein [Solirubrobacteraceae bacterium]